ncbi:lysM and peptidoglycan-binding domain-containing 4 [Pelobates cultripes]|uniref:LysM and putative peptidoglycan-binding domain-containing protein 4 n=1 Tax=Pelobates cultripes TaxID=61616 RepID=A0AAD1RM42_PELCU|nr:lysM and peptidoglycan-binding domain-containing 4 [Pelobates cultripes]
MTLHLRDGASHSFKPPTAIHSSSGSYVYTFLNSSADHGSSSEEEFDVMELRARGGQRKNTAREKVKDVTFLECAVTKDDTLNKLALQYACKVADIKRVNNLILEQDMYALKTIKIPVKVNGILTELQKELNPQQRMHSNLEASGVELTEEMSVDVTESRNLSKYFEEIDANIEAAALVQDLSNEPLIPNSQHSSSYLLRNDQPSIRGDWGIRWNAILIMLLIVVVLPVFYLIYKMREHAYTNSTRSS